MRIFLELRQGTLTNGSPKIPYLLGTTVDICDLDDKLYENYEKHDMVKMNGIVKLGNTRYLESQSVKGIRFQKKARMLVGPSLKLGALLNQVEVKDHVPIVKHQREE